MNESVIGIDLNGIQDCWCSVETIQTPAFNSGFGVIPPVIVTPLSSGERPITGIGALQSITGRGWLWPEEAQSPSKDGFSRRVPVLHLMKLLLEGRREVEAQKDCFYSLSELIANHIKSLAKSRSTSCVLTIPDHSDETFQQRMVDTRFEAGFDKLMLLWRPIASLMSWGNSLNFHQLNDVRGSDALVVYSGPLGFEASVIRLDTEMQDGRLLLTPIRSSLGKTAPREQFSVSDLVDTMAIDCASVLGDKFLAWQMQWGSSFLWTKLLGIKNPSVLFQKSSGEFIELTALPSEIYGSLLGKVATGFEKLLDEFSSNILTGVKHIILDGHFLGIHDSSLRTLGQMITSIIRRRFRSSVSIQDISLEGETFGLSNSVARGAAIYAWRSALSLPTYYDFLPQLEINATSDDKPEFIPLIPKQAKIKGGQSFRHDVTQPFFIPAGAPLLEFYIDKEGDQVRKTTTPLKISPNRDTPVSLVVRQTPGQGHAIVEIHPETPGIFGPRTLTLNWESLLPIFKDKQEVLKDLTVEAGVFCPKHAPVRTHEKIWYSLDAMRTFSRFLETAHNDKSRITGYIYAVEKILDVFRNKRKGSGIGIHDESHTVFSAVSSDGEVPEISKRSFFTMPSSLRERDSLSLFNNTMAKLESDFNYFVSPGNRDDFRTDKLKKLSLAGSWCYAAAPKNVVDYLLEYIKDTSRKTGIQAEAASRCASSPQEIASYLESVEKRFDMSDFNLKWVKGVTQILQFRENSPELLNDTLATKFTIMALKEIRDGLVSGYFKNRFLWGVQLLMLLFRYRLKRRDFLKLDSPEYATLHKIVKQLLTEALLKTKKNRKTSRYIDETLQMLDYRGTNQLIARELASELSGPDSNKETSEDDNIVSIESIQIDHLKGDATKTFDNFESAFRKISGNTVNTSPALKREYINTPPPKKVTPINITPKDSYSSFKAKKLNPYKPMAPKAKPIQIPSAEQIEMPLLKALFQVGGKAELYDLIDKIGATFGIPIEELENEKSPICDRLSQNIRNAAFNLFYRKLVDHTRSGTWIIAPNGMRKLRDDKFF